MAAVRAWLALWAPYGCHWGRGGPLRPVWRGQSPLPCMAAVGTWPVPYTPYGRRVACPVPYAPYGHRGDVAGPLYSVWPCGGVAVQWAPYARSGGVAGLLGPEWPPWGRGRSPGHRLAAVGAWPVPWAPSGCRRGTAGPLSIVWLPLVRGWSPGRIWRSRGRGPLSWPRMVAVQAWPFPRALHGRRGGVAGLLGTVWSPWGVVRPQAPCGCCRSLGYSLAAVGCNWSPGNSLAAVRAWPVPWAPSGHRGGVAVPWASSNSRGGVARPLSF